MSLRLVVVELLNRARVDLFIALKLVMETSLKLVKGVGEIVVSFLTERVMAGKFNVVLILILVADSHVMVSPGMFVGLNIVEIVSFGVLAHVILAFSFHVAAILIHAM